LHGGAGERAYASAWYEKRRPKALCMTEYLVGADKLRESTSMPSRVETWQGAAGRQADARYALPDRRFLGTTP